MNKLFKKLILVIFFSLIFLPSKSGLSQYKPGTLPTAEDAYNIFRNVATTLLEKFPPNEYYYIGVGRSPAIVIAILETLNSKIAQSVPLSSPSALDFDAFLDDSHFMETLDLHFDQFLPSLEKLSGRKIILLDYWITGAGLNFAYRMVTSFYNEKYPGQNLSNFVNTVSFSWRPNIRDVYPFASLHISTNSPLNMPDFKHFSEFESLVPGMKISGEWKQSSEYIHLKKYLKDKVPGDPVFKKALKSLKNSKLSGIILPTLINLLCLLN